MWHELVTIETSGDLIIVDIYVLCVIIKNTPPNNQISLETQCTLQVALTCPFFFFFFWLIWPWNMMNPIPNSNSNYSAGCHEHCLLHHLEPPCQLISGWLRMYRIFHEKYAERKMSFAFHWDDQFLTLSVLYLSVHQKFVLYIPLLNMHTSLIYFLH